MNQMNTSRALLRVLLGAVLVLAAAAPAEAGINRWTSLHGPGGGYVHALARDPLAPSTLYAGTSELGLPKGVFKSTDGGASWRRVSHGISSGGRFVLDLAVSPVEPGTLYVGSHFDGVYKSQDGGETWSRAGQQLAGAVVLDVEIDPVTPGLVYAAGGTLFKSTDGGATWSPLDNGAPGFAFDLAIDPTASQTVYAAGSSEGVFKSIDGGASWIPVNGGLPAVKVVLVEVSPSTPETLYIGTESDGVFKSIDGGASWSSVSSGLPSVEMRSLTVDPLSANTVYAGTYEGVFQTTDGGANWNPITNDLINPQINVTALDAAGNLYVGTQGGGVFKTTDGGATWNPVNPGLDDAFIFVLKVDPSSSSTVYSGGFGSGVHKSTDGGVSWSSAHEGIGSPFIEDLAIDPTQTDTAFVAVTDRGAGPGGVFKTTDGGATWQAMNTGLPTPPSARSVAIHPSTTSTVYAGTGRGVFKSTDGGSNWNAARDGLPQPFATISLLVIDPLNPDTLYTAERDGLDFVIYKTTDGGGEWDSLPRTFSQEPPSLVVDPTNSSILFLAAPGEGVLKSTDGGQSWNPVNTGLPELGVNALVPDPTDPSTLYARLVGAVFKTTDGGVSWSPLTEEGLPIFTALAIDPSDPATLYAALENDAVYKITQVPADSHDDCGSGIPVGVGKFSGDTGIATNDGGASCGSSESSSDVWFRFTAPSDGVFSFNTLGAAYDTVLSVHSACPGTSGNEIACNDNTGGTGQSALVVELTNGQEVLVRVSGFDGATGPFDLSVGQGAFLTGTVTTTATGSPATASVLLYDDGGSRLSTAVTANGVYEFAGLAPGDYFVWAIKPFFVDELYDDLPCGLGCDAVVADPVAVPTGASVPGIDFALTRGGTCDEASDDLTLTGRSFGATAVFEACSSITANSGIEVTPSGELTLRAGERVVLGDGFSVASGGTFRAEIAPELAP